MNFRVFAFCLALAMSVDGQTDDKAVVRIGGAAADDYHLVGGSAVTNAQPRLFGPAANPNVPSNLENAKLELSTFLATLNNNKDKPFVSEAGTLLMDDAVVERHFRPSTTDSPLKQCGYNQNFGAGDSELTIDSHDLFYFSGHGDTYTDRSAKQYCGVQDSCAIMLMPKEADRWWVNSREMKLGRNRLKWFVLSGCNAIPFDLVNELPEWWSNWSSAFQGLHMILGWRSNVDDIIGENVSRRFASALADGKPVGSAWLDAAGPYFDFGKNRPALISAESDEVSTDTYHNDRLDQPVDGISSPQNFNYVYISLFDPLLDSKYSQGATGVVGETKTSYHISVNPSQVNLSANYPSNPVTQRIAVTASGDLNGGSIPLVATSSDESWLQANLIENNTQLIISASPNFFYPGSYTGNIRLCSNPCDNAPIDIPVRLTVSGAQRPSYSSINPYMAAYKMGEGLDCDKLPARMGAAYTDYPIYGFIGIKGAGFLDELGVNLVNPDGQVVKTSSFTPFILPGDKCARYGLIPGSGSILPSLTSGPITLPIGHRTLGTWKMLFTWNGRMVASLPFQIAQPAVPPAKAAASQPSIDALPEGSFEVQEVRP